LEVAAMVVRMVAMQAILTMVDNIVPTSKLSPYMKQWWTPELGTQDKNVKKLARTAYTKRQQCAHPIHAQLKEACNRLSTDIQKAKEEHWIKYLEDIETSNVWDVHKDLVNELSDLFISRIPNLRTNHMIPTPSQQTNQEKSELLYKTFFEPATHQPFTTPPKEYPEPKCTFTNIHKCASATSNKPPSPIQSARTQQSMQYHVHKMC
jgi:hypothetical protein